MTLHRLLRVMLLTLMFFVSMERYPEADETRKMILEYAAAKNRSDTASL